MSRFVRFALVAPVALGLAWGGPAMAQTKAKTAPKAAAKPAGSGNVTRAQLQAQVKKVFDRADTNHDGYMSLQEFAVRMGAVLNRAPGPGEKGAPTKEGMQRMLDAANLAFRDADTNGDGKLSLGESSKRSLTMFDTLDANHDGVLTVAEKAAAKKKMEQAQAGAPGAGLGVGKKKLEPGR